jgi:hypothetical protein
VKKLRLIVLFSLFSLFGLALAFSAAAQAEVTDSTFIFADGTTFEIPEDWTGEMFEGIVSLTDEDSNIVILNFGALAARDFEPDAELIDALEEDFNYAYEFSDGVSFERGGDLETLEIDDREALRYAFRDDVYPGLAYAIRFSDGAYGIVYSYNLAETPADPDEATTLALLETFDSGDPSEVFNAALTTVTTTQTGTLPDGATFTYPPGWALDEMEQGGLVSIDSTGVLLFESAELNAMGITPDLDEETILKAVWTAILEGEISGEFTDGTWATVELAGRNMIRWDLLTDPNALVTVYIVPFSDGGKGVVATSTISDSLPPEAEILSIVASLDR